MDAISEAIFNEIEKNFKQANKLTDDDFEMLFYAFGEMAGFALLLLETSTIHKIETVPPSSFELYKIDSASGRVYYVSRRYHICQCKYFNFTVKKNGRKQTCKHNVYCRIAIMKGEVGPPITIRLEELGKYLYDAFHVEPNDFSRPAGQ